MKITIKILLLIGLICTIEQTWGMKPKPPAQNKAFIEPVDDDDEFNLVQEKPNTNSPNKTSLVMVLGAGTGLDNRELREKEETARALEADLRSQLLAKKKAKLEKYNSEDYKKSEKYQSQKKKLKEARDKLEKLKMAELDDQAELDKANVDFSVAKANLTQYQAALLKPQVDKLQQQRERAKTFSGTIINFAEDTIVSSVDMLKQAVVTEAVHRTANWLFKDKDEETVKTNMVITNLYKSLNNAEALEENCINNYGENSELCKRFKAYKNQVYGQLLRKLPQANDTEKVQIQFELQKKEALLKKIEDARGPFEKNKLIQKYKREFGEESPITLDAKIPTDHKPISENQESAEQLERKTLLNSTIA